MISDFMFGQWLPDQPDLNNPGLIEAKNVYPVGSAYEPISGPVASSATVPGEVCGAARTIRPDGSQLMSFGTRSNLYAVSGGTVTASALSSGPSVGSWTFVPFGKSLWAFAPSMAPHYIPDVNVSAVFVPHPSSAPRAATAARVVDFIVAGNLSSDIDGSNDPYRIRWSRFNDPASNWGDDALYQSGAVSMPASSGAVVAIAGGDYGLIMQRYGVSRLDYTGGASIFSKRMISEGRGCASAQSVVQVAGVTYFLSDDGFFRTDGASVQAISSNLVFGWFSNVASGAAMDRVQGAINWRARCIIWSFVSSQSLGGYDAQIIYSWESNRWAFASLGTDWLLDTVQEGLTLEQVSAIYPNLDTMPLSLDSPTFMARGRALTAIKGGAICTMSGPTLEASFETAEFQPASGYRCRVDGVAVLVESVEPLATVSLGARDTFKGQAVRWTQPQPEGPDGMAHPIIDGRYVRARVVLPEGAGWTKAQGIQAEFRKTGRI